jgi:hypothetical protein
MLFAFRSTDVTAFSAADARWARERALASGESRGKLTAFRAVGAELGSLGMFLFTPFKHRQAVLEAGVALQLAIGADLRALHEMLGVLVFARDRLQSEGDEP